MGCVLAPLPSLRNWPAGKRRASGRKGTLTLALLCSVADSEQQPPAAEPGAGEEQHAGDGPQATLEQQLFQAAAAGDTAHVQALLAAGAEPACEAEGGVTPLMLAAESGSVEAVRALLEAGAPWQAQDAEGYTAGDYASGGKHRAVVQQLLDWAVKAELILGE
jgi:hypothetical protein